MPGLFEIPRSGIPFEPGLKLELEQTLLASMGSCFSERFPVLMSETGVKCLANPCGILYNPVSLADAVSRSLNGPAWTEEDFFLFDGLWHSWHHHGSFSAADRQKAVFKAENARTEFGAFLKKAGVFLLTPATAVVFRLRETGQVTANCHKLPGTLFQRELLSVEECLGSFERIFRDVLQNNPSCRIVAGVSPVRHHPGDPLLNSRSKAIVNVALRQAVEKFPQVVYFPGLEYMNDVLRDYRFYREDLCHPSETAEKYILSRLASGLFGEEGVRRLEEAYRMERTRCHHSIREEQ